MNKNNPNKGGAGLGHEAYRSIAPRQVDVEEPMELWTANKVLSGPDFLDGEPKGREANPKPKHDGDLSVYGL